MELVRLAERVSELRNSDKFNTPEYDEAIFELWSAMKGDHRVVMRQLMKAPTWDGDIASKSARDDLIDAGLAVRCCYGFEDGYATATYLAGSVWRVMHEAHR
jgi:hypothetical protein